MLGIPVSLTYFRNISFHSVLGFPSRSLSSSSLFRHILPPCLMAGIQVLVCGPCSSRMHPTPPSLALGAWGALRISCLSPAPVPVPGPEAPSGNVCGDCARISSWQQLTDCWLSPKRRTCVLCYPGSCLFVPKKFTLSHCDYSNPNQKQ